MANALDRFKPVTSYGSSSSGNALDKFRPKKEKNIYRNQDQDMSNFSIQDWAEDNERLDDLREYMTKRL